MRPRLEGDLVLPPAPWRWTDDTEMACSLVQALRRDGRVDQDQLALAFALRWSADRGYGRGAVSLMSSIRDGVPWRTAAGALFSGCGSSGNGAAMRVAPLGAFFADDPDLAARQAALSAEVTHQHPEGVAGAVAVALAAAHAARHAEPGTLLRLVLNQLPPSDVRDGVARAARLLTATDPCEVADELGNGSHALAQDTVPYALWVAATRFDDYPAAIEACVRAGGDVDSMCAIAGGVVAAHTGVAGIPPEWIGSREPLPEWSQSP
ncbi:ADP-ribosylglycohydrolase family protein [Dactylosporangium fulvum]|uniref:ADP-ribosylglycohydrolase family protein n=2 Tax=Dactylosporangium fulvum TaxID=53359 RepID=A0ABY5WEC9_9ACTN|nr:ADP-ribosylglycohydrolase family protein [Dactylosporangium fulvum]UWP87769.1 ADP-ribosylglycohydrolase family protein [Dactylosporangium fulvum]